MTIHQSSLERRRQFNMEEKLKVYCGFFACLFLIRFDASAVDLPRYDIKAILSVISEFLCFVLFLSGCWKKRVHGLSKEMLNIGTQSTQGD